MTKEKRRTMGAAKEGGKGRKRSSEEALGRALERLRALFPNKSPSWIRRALARVSDVDPVDEGLMLYLVRGRPELGDAKGQYQVFSKDGRWYCTCYSRFGARRAGEACTHVAAVMLYRRYKAQLERLRGPIEEKLYICAAEVECASGVVYVKELSEGVERGPIALKARPRGKTLADWGLFSVIAVSRSPEVLICCRARGSSPCRRVQCKEAAPGEAAAVMGE